MRCWWVGAVVSLSLGAASTARADLASLRRDLQTGDDVRADEAAKQIAASKEPKAVDTIIEVLALGIPPRQSGVLLGGLAGRHDSRSVEVLGVFAHNRNPELRIHAVQLLCALPDPKVTPMLLAALSDSMPEVRAAAAKALGQRKEHAAEPKLLEMLQRRDPSAPEAVAAIATPALAHRLSEMIGPIPDALLCDTFGEILKRPDFGPDPIRVEIVKTLGKIPGDDSTTSLLEYLQTTDKDPKRPSRLEAEAIVNQRKGS